MKHLPYVAAGAIAALVACNAVTFLRAQEKPAVEVGTCPTDKPCKILTLAPDQVDTLDQIITNTSVQGPYSQVKQIVEFYKDMLAKAPAGKPGKPEEVKK